MMFQLSGLRQMVPPTLRRIRHFGSVPVRQTADGFPYHKVSLHRALRMKYHTELNKALKFYRALPKDQFEAAELELLDLPVCLGNQRCLNENTVKTIKNVLDAEKALTCSLELSVTLLMQFLQSEEGDAIPTATTAMFYKLLGEKVKLEEILMPSEAEYQIAKEDFFTIWKRHPAAAYVKGFEGHEEKKVPVAIQTYERMSELAHLVNQTKAARSRVLWAIARSLELVIGSDALAGPFF